MSWRHNNLEQESDVRAWVCGACGLEAWARKAGNVHPGRSFRDTDFDDFLDSAQAASGPLAGASRRPLGETLLQAVEATCHATGRNTNLGILLLLGPLAAAPPRLLRQALGVQGRKRLRAWLESYLASLTVRDAELAYAAIRLARPGGLGTAEHGDVNRQPTGTLLDMMRLSSGRDLVALQYANTFKQVIDEGLPLFKAAMKSGLGLEASILRLHLELLARHGDSLIERKCGPESAAEARARARRVLASGWPDGAGASAELASLDAWLRARDNQRNPGATADLVAAVLFLALASGIISPSVLALFGNSCSMQKYKVRVAKDYIGFCSAHFISFEGTQCERLHGHNYKVAAEIEAPLNDDYLVFDFIVLKNILREITNELDHRMLVPLKSKALEIQVGDEEVEIRYRTKRWLFPREDCALMEIENTTAELLAAWVAQRLREALTRQRPDAPSPGRLPEVLRVEVEESPGQCAVYETLC